MRIIAKRKLNIRTAYGKYTIVLEKWEGDHSYVVRVPKHREIITQGGTINEAKKMAREAIELCIDCENNEHYTDIKSKRNTTLVAASRV